MHQNRRRFLTSAGAAFAALPAALREALAVPAHHRTGTIQDVEHVVVLMQENRSFDHYFGTLRGVRGYGDPRPLVLPSGKTVWHQPSRTNADGFIAPFHMDTSRTSAQCLESLDHSWKGSQERWKHHDAWIDTKGPMTMGHFTRADIPFYHALADAFTICDAYHCSVFGPTNPNRLFLFTGTSGLAVGESGPLAITNPPDEGNETADPANDTAAFKPFGWTTYAERLEQAGVGWRVYQEYDNYGDNGLAYFANFRGAGAASAIGKKARPCSPGSTPANAKTSRGEHLIAEFAGDVAADRLPQVSWIVAPYIICEHPSAPPGYGETFVSGLLSALAANPKVWAKTVFILNYDENDGFFDHVPPPVPPLGDAKGKSTVDLAGEDYHGVPMGLGPRVPLLIVSPWTRGGFVNSQLSDHTSVLRFLEARFGVAEPNITPWRRAVCSDLTSMFDFARPNDARESLPATHGTNAAVDLSCKNAHPAVPTVQTLPRQEPGQRPARPLPYDIEALATAQQDGMHVRIENRGKVGVALAVHADGGRDGPWHYTLAAGTSIDDILPFDGEHYAFTLYGPNGFLRRFSGRRGGDSLDVRLHQYPEHSGLRIALSNIGTHPLTVIMPANVYLHTQQGRLTLAGGAKQEVIVSIVDSAHWYDLPVMIAEDPSFLRRFAGHIETGAASLSDPALG
jgi:phospholipase C